MKTITKRIEAIWAILFCMAVFHTEVHAQEHTSAQKFIKGFSGGMMVHTGYLCGSDNPFNYSLSGATFGIGGVAKLHMTKHFRAGFEGYYSNMGLDKGVADGSFNKMFWTGLLGDWYWKIGKFYPYVGLTLGGGMETAFYMFDGSSEDWKLEKEVVFNKNAFFAADPFIGVEYAVGSAFRLTLKADWLIAVNRNGLNHPSGPRLYFGFIFAH